MDQERQEPPADDGVMGGLLVSTARAGDAPASEAHHEVHQTAVFVVHRPTRHVRAALERAFRDYTSAYTELLHACRRYSPDDLRGMATYALDAKSGRPRMSARTLSHRLYADPAVARTLAGVAAPLEARLRQSVREHVAQTLMSYLALGDAHGEHAVDADDTARAAGGAPSYPARLRPREAETSRVAALAALADLPDDLPRERELVAALKRTRRAGAVAIPFVGVDARYGCGLYHCRETGRFYARLDVVGRGSRLGRPITARGHYTEVKTGVVYQAGHQIGHQIGHQVGAPEAGRGGVSFGRGGKSVLVPLEMGRRHERSRRWLHAAFLPQRGVFDHTHPAPAIPISAKLVRRPSGMPGTSSSSMDTSRVLPLYELHVAFALPVPPRGADGLTEEARPLLAINRGICHTYAAVVTDAQATQAFGAFVASGQTLRAQQEALERVRRARQQRGAHIPAGDRRQSRLAEHHVALCANQLVELAVCHRAQVVMEDLSAFAGGRAIRQVAARPQGRRAALRAILNRRQFEALRRAVDGRLALVGLPPVRTVPAAWISQTCLACGHRDAGNRDPDEPRLFRCGRCGCSGDVDVLAAANVARKLAWLRARGRPQQQTAGGLEEVRTTWDAFAAGRPLVVPGVAADGGER
jgi:hypothetical protein